MDRRKRSNIDESSLLPVLRNAMQSVAGRHGQVRCIVPGIYVRQKQFVGLVKYCKIVHGSWYQGPGSRILDPKYRIQDPASRIKDLGSEIQYPGSYIENPGSRIQDPGPRILHPGCGMQDPGTKIPDPG